MHLSDTSEEAIRELRKEQPWSKIFGVTGGMKGLLGIRQRELDTIYWAGTIGPKEAESMLKKTGEIYTINKNL